MPARLADSEAFRAISKPRLEFGIAMGLLTMSVMLSFAP
jgi:hypothetical protein